MERHTLSDGDHASRGTAVFTVVVIMTCLSSVFVGLRFISRAGIVKRFMLDDYFIFLAWLLVVGMSCSICVGTWNGLGRHEIYVPTAWQSALLKSQYSFSVLYVGDLLSPYTLVFER